MITWLLRVLYVDKEHLDTDSHLLSLHVEAHHGVPLPVPDTFAPHQAALPKLLLKENKFESFYRKGKNIFILFFFL